LQRTRSGLIVFPVAGDPLGTGLVTSLARPGGNVTGLSNQGADLAGKRIEALREVDPRLRKLAVLVNDEYAGRMTEIANTNTAVQTLGLDVSVFEIKTDEDHLAAVFLAIGKEGADALYVIGDTFMNSSRVRIGSLALQA
jgi:putative ABC transport system substrate-binding protein